MSRELKTEMKSIWQGVGFYANAEEGADCREGSERAALSSAPRGCEAQAGRPAQTQLRGQARDRPGRGQGQADLSGLHRGWLLLRAHGLLKAFGEGGGTTWFNGSVFLRGSGPVHFGKWPVSSVGHAWGTTGGRRGAASAALVGVGGAAR